MIDAKNPEQTANPRRIFTFLLFYRWLSLIIPLAAWLWAPESSLLLALLAAAAVNGVISFFSRQLNHILRRHTWLLAADLALMAGLTTFTGGWRTPFYLYSLNPFLIAAFFFGLRGAVTAVTAFLPFYALALYAALLRLAEPINWLFVATTVVGYYLIGGTFGFAAGLVSRLHQAREDLIHSHRELNTLHELTVSLQSAADVEQVQEKVLDAVTADLGFRKAVIGLVDPNRAIITSWLGRDRNDLFSGNGQAIHSTQVPLTPDGGLVAEALLARRVHQVSEGHCSTNAQLNQSLAMTTCHIFPLLLREHIIGVLLVDTHEETAGSLSEDGRFASLESIAGQAAVAIGTTLLCIDRAQQVAVQEERLRIAQDLHDNVSQSLFGIVYTLDGSLKLLPEQPEIARPELERALETAEQVRSDIRQSILDIWPTELTAERFTADLRKYAQKTCPIDSLELIFDVRGEFSTLSPQARRSLYRITQEALANIGRHALASQARVCIDIAEGQAHLVVRDNGKGFDPAKISIRQDGREHFGLRGIQERARSLGGECHIHSQPEAGTSVIVDIPVNEK